MKTVICGYSVVGAEHRVLPKFEHLRHLRIYFHGKYCLSGGVKFETVRRVDYGLPAWELTYTPPWGGTYGKSYRVVFWLQRQ